MRLAQHPIAFQYDGTLDGLLCCVFAAFTQKRLPSALTAPTCAQFPLFPMEVVETDPAHARRVAKGIIGRIGQDMLEALGDSLLCARESAPLSALEMVALGFDIGPDIWGHVAMPCVHDLTGALKHLRGEAHLLTGFLRFREVSGALIATIAPKNRALPLLAPHFIERFAMESFLIYDEVHREILLHQGGNTGIFPVEDYAPPPMDESDEFAASLWQAYFKAVSIKQRENPKCQRGHMPKRYWAHMIEMSAQVCYNGEKQLGGNAHDSALSPQALP